MLYLVVKQLETEEGANPLQEGAAPFDKYWTHQKNDEQVKSILKEPKKTGALVYLWMTGPQLK